MGNKLLKSKNNFLQCCMCPLTYLASLVPGDFFFDFNFYLNISYFNALFFVKYLVLIELRIYSSKIKNQLWTFVLSPAKGAIKSNAIQVGASAFDNHV